MIAMVDFKIYNLFQQILIQESGAEVSTSFHLWNKNRRAMDRADSRDLNLLSNIAGGETKPWFDPVYRSLVLHDKMLFEEENERSESGAEVSTSFHSVE